MTVLVNKNLAAAMSHSYAWGRFSNPYYHQLHLCIGAYPTSGEIDQIQAVSDARVSNNVTASMNTTGSVIDVVSPTDIPPNWYWKTLPTTKTFTASKTGTLSWALFDIGIGPPSFIVTDVGLPGSGACVIVDKVDVVIGTVVTLQSVSFKLWR